MPVDRSRSFGKVTEGRTGVKLKSNDLVAQAALRHGIYSRLPKFRPSSPSRRVAFNRNSRGISSPSHTISGLNGVEATCSSAFAWPAADRPNETGRPIRTDSPTLPSNHFATPFLWLAPLQCCPLPLAGIPASAFPPSHQTPSP